MRRVAENIYIIDTCAFGQERLIASYVVKGRDKTAVIDPGFPSSAPVVREALRTGGFDPAGIDYVVLTHFHLDHTGGTGALIAEAPGAKVVVHKRAAFYIRNFGKIVGGARMVFRPELIREFGEALPVPHDSIVSVVDGDSIDLGGGASLRVIHTPGHCGDEVSYFEEASGAIFTGDAACLQYPDLGHVPIPAGSPPLFDIADELASLKRLRAVPVGKILIPHFGEIEGSWKDFVDRNVEAIGETRRKITGMFREKAEFPQMVERLRCDIIRDSGRSEAEIPDLLSKVYIREMLKTGLMGFLAYLLEYAPYPRAFSKEACRADVS